MEILRVEVLDPLKVGQASRRGRRRGRSGRGDASDREPVRNREIVQEGRNR